MTRSVVALYDTRPEAEVARARLSAQYDTERVQILGRDDLGRLEQLGFGDDDATTYRQALGQGSVLLVAEVAANEDSERIVALLRDSAAGEGAAAAAPLAGRSGIAATSGAQEVHIPVADEELRIGKREVERGGARVRSFTREQPFEEDVTLREEHLETETRVADRRLSLDQAEAAGLLKNRVIEVSAMREEAVVVKQAVVREEIVIKKTVSERIEAISDTVRSTQVEMEELDRPKTGI
jgi:stress response protein YsnF